MCEVVNCEGLLSLLWTPSSRRDSNPRSLFFKSKQRQEEREEEQQSTTKPVTLVKRGKRTHLEPKFSAQT